MKLRIPFTRPEFSPIGLDVGTQVIKAVQVRRRRGGAPAISAAATLARVHPGDPVLAADDLDRLMQVLDRRGFSGQEFILAAPVGRVESDMLELPARSSGAPVEMLAASEIGRSAKLAPGTYEAASWELPIVRAGAGCAVMAVALRHVDAETMMAPFDATGCRVTGIGTAAQALAQCITWTAAAASQAPAAAKEVNSLVAALDIGWESGSIALLSNGRVLFQRILPDAGIAPLYRQIASQYSLSTAAVDLLLCDATHSSPLGDFRAWVGAQVRQYAALVAEELKASLAFGRHRFGGLVLSDIWAIGGGNKVRGLLESLGQQVHPAITPLPSPSHIMVPQELKASFEWTQMAVATGLALLRSEGA